MSTKTNKQVKKKRKEKKRDKGSFYKFKIKPGQTFAYIEYVLIIAISIRLFFQGLNPCPRTTLP